MRVSARFPAVLVIIFVFCLVSVLWTLRKMRRDAKRGIPRSKLDRMRPGALVLCFFAAWAWSSAANRPPDAGVVLEQMSGCFQVDYNYSEVEVLKEGYVLDQRVYDASRDKLLFEYIAAIEVRRDYAWLQHVLFIVDETGETVLTMRHHGENWIRGSHTFYDYAGANRWVPEPVQGAELWTREILALDDGPRHACAARWEFSGLGSYWECENFSPIPGRETRDMGRSDYNALQRRTKVILQDWGWLERQDNVKIVFEAGDKTRLAREVGKNYYIRVDQSRCAEAKAWVEERLPFWQLAREVWREILDGRNAFASRKSIDGTPRFAKIWELESEYHNRNLEDPEIRRAAQSAVRDVIRKYLKE